MKITEVKVFPSQESGRLKAYATIVFDNDFIVRDLKVIEGNKGLFVSMPSRRKKDGSFRDIVHPLNSDTRTMIEQSIIVEYDKSDEIGPVYPMETVHDATLKYKKLVGASPSGKAPGFGPGIRRFESFRPRPRHF